MKFGFFGAGNMVSAIAKGMTIGTKLFDGNNIYITSKSITSAKTLANICGANACESATEVIDNSDVIVLGVKPHILPQILPQLKSTFSKRKPLIVSIAAGKTLAQLAEFFDEGTPIIRVMPNINAKVAASTTGVCANSFATTKQKDEITKIFSTIGTVIEVDENQFGMFSVLASSSVAFTYLYLDAFARAGVKAGLPKTKALEIIAHATMGSAKMILESGEVPMSLVDQTCSPGGMTIEGIAALQENAFESSIMKAFDATLAKEKILGN